MQIELEISFGKEKKIIPTGLDVIRLGSDAEHEVRIPALEKHLLTIRNDREGVRIYPRGESSIQLAQKPLTKNQMVQWPANAPLTLPHGYGLRWKPAKASALTPSIQKGDSMAEKGGVIAEPKPSRLRQVGIVAVLLITMQYYLSTSTPKVSEGEKGRQILLELKTLVHTPKGEHAATQQLQHFVYSFQCVLLLQKDSAGLTSPVATESLRQHKRRLREIASGLGGESKQIVDKAIAFAIQ